MSEIKIRKDSLKDIGSKFGLTEEKSVEIKAIDELLNECDTKINALKTVPEKKSKGLFDAFRFFSSVPSSDRAPLLDQEESATEMTQEMNYFF